MFAARNLHRHSFKSLSSLLHFRPSRSILISRDFYAKVVSSNVVEPSKARENDGLSFSSPAMLDPFGAGRRSMSTSTPPRGRSMRSKVERRMKRETGKTMREVRRAKKIQKKLMTENERLIYNLKRAKRKVAVLLQKLKKYELPELPPPRHDPEILTPEQLQAYKKIGFKNKNYLTVGVRGVFGGVVQNMHMHWKFHETVQVCCDNFPKEKIKEMATMLARLSGGIVINIHNVKTIIMYRGRNYRQPKNLIPINTLTKRKALFKARFEQALESQKLNIKKIEQQLRRSGINPEDPAATASIQRVASSFFNAIDKKEGTPYVFREEKPSLMEPNNNFEPLEPADERERAELDKFIADIEDAAEREWAAEEAAEKEDFGRIRYWNREEFGGRFRRSETSRGDRSDDEIQGSRDWRDMRVKPRTFESDNEDDDDGSEADDEWQSHNADDYSNTDDSDESEKFEVSRGDWGMQEKIGRARSDDRYKRNQSVNFRKSIVEEESETIRHLEKAMWQSDDDEHNSSASRATNHNYRSESDEEEDFIDLNKQKHGIVMYESGADDSDKSQSRLDESRFAQGKQIGTCSAANNAYTLRSTGASLGQKSSWQDGDGEEDMQTSGFRNSNFLSSGDEEEKYQAEKDSKNGISIKTRTRRERDETWDGD